MHDFCNIFQTLSRRLNSQQTLSTYNLSLIDEDLKKDCFFTTISSGYSGQKILLTGPSARKYRDLMATCYRENTDLNETLQNTSQIISNEKKLKDINSHNVFLDIFVKRTPKNKFKFVGIDFVNRCGAPAKFYKSEPNGQLLLPF